MKELEINQGDISEDVETDCLQKSNLIFPPTLDTDNWKFDREEANER